MAKKQTTESILGALTFSSGQPLDEQGKIGALVHYIYCRRYGSSGFAGWREQFGCSEHDTANILVTSVEGTAAFVLEHVLGIEKETVIGMLVAYVDMYPEGSTFATWAEEFLDLDAGALSTPEGIRALEAAKEAESSEDDDGGEGDESEEEEEEDNGPPFTPTPEPKPKASKKDLPGQATLPFPEEPAKPEKAAKARKPPSLLGKTVRFRPTGKKYHIGVVTEDDRGPTITINELLEGGDSKDWTGIKREGVTVVMAKADIAAGTGDAPSPDAEPDVVIEIPAREHARHLALLEGKTGISKAKGHEYGQCISHYKAELEGYLVSVEVVNGDPTGGDGGTPARAFVDIYVTKEGSNPTFAHKPITDAIDGKFAVVLGRKKRILEIRSA